MNKKLSAPHSMTGFATLDTVISGTPVKVEIKSLNHRFLDIKIRIPREYMGFESAIRAELTAGISRGSIEFGIFHPKDESHRTAKYVPDFDTAKSYLAAVRVLQKKFKLPGKIEISQLMSRGDLVRVEDQSTTAPSEKTWEHLKKIIHQAISELKLARSKEGAHLVSKVFHPFISVMRTGFRIIGELREAGKSSYKDRIKTKIDQLFDSYNIETHGTEAILETRLAQELALLLDRTDIEEERVRFGKHLDHLEAIITEGGPIGRKIDFVLQELSREINTLGNKAQDVAISEEVVKIKVKLEQLREQGLNLE